MKVKLDNCPFCGAVSRVSYNDALSTYGRKGIMTTVICTGCRCRISRWGKTAEDGLRRAAKAWNRRPHNIEV